jgi:hypothetical protein
VPKSIATVDDGNLPISDGEQGDVNRGPESESGNTEPQRTIAGFATVSPFAVPNPADTIEFTDGAGSSGEPPRKRRGRPPGSKNATATAKAQTSQTLEGLEKLLLSVHMMGAKLLAFPELEIEPSEAARLSDAIKEVAKHYSFQIDPKHMAIWQLTMCAGSIYGPRVVQMMRKKPGPRAVTPIDRNKEDKKDGPSIVQPPVTQTVTPEPSNNNKPVNFAPSAVWSELPSQTPEIG